MEDSKVQERVLNLGRIIVKELELDPGADTLAKWMAHYIAGKIESVEKLSGKKRQEAEKECFETILKLWQHKWVIPKGKPFFNDFESLFETIEKLNPKKITPFFLPAKFVFDIEAENPKSDSDHNDDGIEDKKPNSKLLLDKALQVDKLARSLISDLLKQAVTKLDLTPEREELIRTSIKTIDYPESRIIRFVSDHIKFLDRPEEEPDENKKRIVQVKSKLIQLQELTSIIESLSRIYTEELSKLKN